MVKYEKKLKYLLIGLYIVGVLLYAGIIHYALQPKKIAVSRRQQLVGGIDDHPTIGNNVIPITFQSDTSDNFVIKSDNHDYVGLGGGVEMLFSVTNVSTTSQSAAIVFSSGPKVNVTKAYRFDGNNSGTIDQIQYATSTEGVVSTSTIQVPNPTPIWTSLTLSLPIFNSSKATFSIGDRVRKNGFRETFDPGVTKYYKAIVNIPVGVNNDEFYVEAFGGTDYGQLDPTAWSYEQKFNTLSLGSISGQDSFTLDSAPVTVVNDQVYEGTQSLKSVSGIAHRVFSAIDSGEMFVAMRKDGGQGCEFNPSSNNYQYGWKIGWYGSTNVFNIQNAAGSPSENISGLTTSDNTWYVLDIQFQVSTYIQARVRAWNGSSWTSFTSWITGYNNGTSVVGFYHREESGNNCWYDDITPTDPTGTSSPVTIVPKIQTPLMFQ